MMMQKMVVRAQSPVFRCCMINMRCALCTAWNRESPSQEENSSALNLNSSRTEQPRRAPWARVPNGRVGSPKISADMRNASSNSNARHLFDSNLCHCRLRDPRGATGASPQGTGHFPQPGPALLNKLNFRGSCRHCRPVNSVLLPTPDTARGTGATAPTHPRRRFLNRALAAALLERSTQHAGQHAACTAAGAHRLEGVDRVAEVRGAVA